MDQLELSVFKKIVQRGLLNGEGDSMIRFLIEKNAPFDQYQHKIFFRDFKWGEIYDLIEAEKPVRGYTHKILIELQLDGEIKYEELNTVEHSTVSFSEVLECRMFFAPQKQFTYLLADKKMVELETYFSTIFNAKKEIALKDTKDILGFGNFADVMRKSRGNSFPKPFKDFHVYHDLARTVEDFNYMISTLKVYRPYIQNLLDSKVKINGEDLFRYFPSYFDKLYMMNAGLTFSLFYNFWDKIGDLLDNCFGVISPGRNVYFGTVIARFPISYHASVHYKWLKDFKDNEFDKLLQRRNNIVHYTALESQIYQGYMNNLQDENEIEKLQDEIYSYVRFFQGQARLALEGFQQTVKLIDEIP